MNADLLKKYHQDLVYNYSEYPTKDHWDFKFNSENFQNALLEWFPNNKDKKIFFYVHIPFCEQLCWFCTCSKYITKDKNQISQYLEYLNKEIDLLFNFLQNNKIELNVSTVFFGGGSPTILSEVQLKNLVEKLRGLFDWSNVEYFTIETDPRRVDEERLIFNHEVCGANRISFGMQDLDPEVQRRVNRIQPKELFDELLTDRVRAVYKEIAVDLLIGQPGQTVETMAKTCDELIKIKPTLIQLSLMAYKPWVAKYQVQMLSEGPLPDFFERKALLDVIHEKLGAAGYVRSGFECYSIPDSPMTKAFEAGDAHYGASGHQPGARVNFLAVGSSSMSNLGFDYYSQNFYDLESYKASLDKGNLPVFRGMKLSEDDKIRQHATQQIRSFFELDYKDFNKNFNINFIDYFKKEINALKEFERDKLITIDMDRIKLTIIGQDFVQRIMNVFDKYDPPEKNYTDRLKAIKIAKAKQSEIQQELSKE
jgi:oxygen-independent coproporphyrinogen-3 oxidase